MWKTENRALQLTSCSRSNKQGRMGENFPEMKTLHMQISGAHFVLGNKVLHGKVHHAATIRKWHEENKTKQATTTGDNSKTCCCRGTKILLTSDFLSATVNMKINRDICIWIACVKNVADSRIIYPGLLLFMFSDVQGLVNCTVGAIIILSALYRI